MVSRVVLGCGAVGVTLVERLAEHHGVEAVVCESETRVETLRDSGIDATTGDPADPSVLAELPEADVVVVATDDASRNHRIATVATERYPGAFCFAYAGQGVDEETYQALSETADLVLDPTPALLSAITRQVVGERADDARRLRAVLREVEGTLAVVMHDNPDPDAIASAVALADLANALGCPAEPCYFGEISHQENRALVNLLDLDLRRLESAEEALEAFGGFALVDHSRPGVNDQLPEGMTVDVVIDHHPPRGAVPARYADLREDVGSTSTLVLDHLDRFGITPSETAATALMYGIQVDTHEFSREVSTLDFEAAASLLATVDSALLERVESPSISGETMDTLSNAIQQRTVRGSVLASFAGTITDRDALPQAADKLLTMEGITTVLVYGVMDDVVYMSARARGTDVDLGETLRVAFDHIGSAGGHADMAGAQVPVTDAFGDTEAERLESARGVISEAFFEALRERPARLATRELDDGSVRFGFERVMDLDD